MRDATDDHEHDDDRPAAATSPWSGDVVRREVVLGAPVAAVWASFVDADGLEGWLADEVDLDVRPGGRGTVRDAGGPERPVEVEEVVPGRRLALAWCDADGRPSVVDLTVEPAGEDTTRVVAVELPAATLALVGRAADRIRAAAGPSAMARPLARA